MMVDKGDSDDQLIEALKEENQNLRDALQKMVQKLRDGDTSRVLREARAAGVSAAPSGASEMESEIIRLNRLIKQQVCSRVVFLIPPPQLNYNNKGVAIGGPG